MNNRDNNWDWTAAWATVLTLAIVAAAFFALRVVVTMMVRAYTKYGRHPVMLGAAVACGLAILFALVVAQAPGYGSLAFSVGAIATVLWVGVVAITEVILDHRAPQEADDLLPNHLPRNWWPD